MTSAQTLAYAVAVLCGAVIPAVVDLVTKSKAPKLLKGAAALVLAGAAGSLSTVAWTPGESWTHYTLAVAVAFVVAIAAHSTGYTDNLEAKTAELGIGPATKPADPLGG
jgi:hypothetical protein